MNSDAVSQSIVRLQKAKNAAERLEKAKSYEEAEDAWTDFLLAGSAIYSKLQQGAKSSSKSQAWFGIKKKERKDDELLRYIHHARNSDEHGIEHVTERRGRSYD